MAGRRGFPWRSCGWAATLVLAGSVAMAVPAAAAAAPPLPAGPAAGTGSFPGSSSGTASAVRGRAALGPVTLTLVTGDTVTYTRDRNGHASVATRLGAGRDAVTFQASSGPDGRYYVIPSDAAAAVAAGTLDKELFDVDYLAGHGYASTDRLPLIVQYASAPTAAAPARLPGATSTTALPGVHGAAVTVRRAQAGQFWAAVRTAPAGSSTTPDGAGATSHGLASARLGSGLSRVWLDAKVATLDDVSDAQIGAPVAWAAGQDGTGAEVGIIDTGIDQTHPDLAGKVVAAQSFVPAGAPGGGNPADVTDRVGHGTHVASIIAGTGTASGGRYKGVAPGARLLIAKGLDDTGSGSDSTIIQAMQWEAGSQHARVVSMSLGGGPTNGTDPLSQAVNALTAQYGTLFVIAAGNSGPGRDTVAAPGAAASALTVGAVDRSDTLATFSSRGPRVGNDFLVKPEIAAPGVSIVAARAAGTSLGTGDGIAADGPVDQNYTSASGTSMATPHVAAAAAILAVQHPTWTPAQLKAALVGTAHDDGYTVYEQGAGRLDLGRAATQTVVADTADISAGEFTYPYGAARTYHVSYANGGSSPVTLDLGTDLSTGGSHVTGMMSVSQPTLTVPAGGSAGIDVSIDPTAGSPGLYSGRVLATDPAGDRVTVPVGFYKQPKQDTLTVTLIGGDRPIALASPLSALRVNDTVAALSGEPNSVQTMAVKPTGQPNSYQVTLTLADGGIYALDTMLRWQTPGTGVMGWAFLDRPQVELTGDTAVTLDARALVPIRTITPRPAQPVVMNLASQRTTQAGWAVENAMVASYPAVAPGGFYALPTATPTIGSYQFWFDTTAVARQVTIELSGHHDELTLAPLYLSERDSDVAKFGSDRRVGTATEADLLSGADVHGKLVAIGDGSLATLLSELDTAIAGGAAGVLTTNRLAWVLPSPAYAAHTRIPIMWLDPDQAARLRTALAGTERPDGRVHAQLVAPYEYKLAYYLRGRVPADLTFRPSDRQLARVAATYHADYAPATGTWGSGPDMFEGTDTFVPGQGLSIKAGHGFYGPTARVEFVNDPGPDVEIAQSLLIDDPVSGANRLAFTHRGPFAAGSHQREDWNETLLPTQALIGPGWTNDPIAHLACDSCRQGNILRLRSLAGASLGQYSTASDPSQLYDGEPGQETAHLYLADGTELAPGHDLLGLPYYTVPSAPGSYRLTDTFQDGFPARHTGTTVSTTWTFRSAAPTGTDVSAPYLCIDTVLTGDHDPCSWQPLIFLHYRLGLPADDTVPAGHPLGFTVSAQNGSPTTSARLAGLRMWASADGGGTWSPAVTLPGPDRSYRVLVPGLGTPGGTVTLRAQAWDAAGNRVEQTIADAYRLK